VRALRERLGMTQNLFAARFGFPLATLRHWEYGRRKPSGASLTLLNVIAHNPRAVLQALRPPAGAQLRPLEDYVALAEVALARDEAERRASWSGDYGEDGDFAE
jgi:transcriptional regulator with XRE-family HTH domain